MTESKYTIPFTQYLRPNGRKRRVESPVTKEVAMKAKAMLNAGMRFECEELSTGVVSLTVVDMVDGEEDDVAMELVPNGPGVPSAVEKLITQAYRLLPIQTREEQT